MKKLFTAGIFFLLIAFSLKTVSASEGQTILTNRVGDAATCWVGSVQMQNDNFTILFSCRDITYPGGTEVFSYVLWANPTDGSDAIRLGIIGFGKGQFKSSKPFRTLFVTKEGTTSPRTPAGPIVMQGNVQALPGLSQNGRTASPSGTNVPSATDEQPIVEETPLATAQPRTGIARFLTSGILAVLGIAGLIFIIFIITKR